MSTEVPDFGRLHLEIGGFNRLEIVDSLSPSVDHSALPSTGYGSGDDGSLASPSLDSGIMINVARLQVFYNDEADVTTAGRTASIRKRKTDVTVRASMRARKGKVGKSGTRFAAQRQSLRKNAVGVANQNVERSLTAILKDVPERGHIWMWPAMDAGRLSYCQRCHLYQMWWKSRELLTREIRFYALLAAAATRRKATRKRTKKPTTVLDEWPSVVPKPLLDQTRSSSGHDDGTECLFLEDLTERWRVSGAQRTDALLGLSKSQVDAAIVAIAEFHAFSAARIDQRTMLDALGFQEPEQRKTLLLRQWLFRRLKRLPASVLSVMDGWRDDEWRGLRRFIDGVAPVPHYATLLPHLGIRPVLSHGDFCAKHVYFSRKAEANGRGGEEEWTVDAILDWKLARPSTGLNDVARLILISVNSSLRLQHTDAWLRLYCTTFNRHRSALLSSGGKRRITSTAYTPDAVRRAYRAELSAEALYAMVFLADTLERASSSAADHRVATALTGRLVHTIQMALGMGL